MTQGTTAPQLALATTDRFTTAFRHHAAGVAVVTFRAPAEPGAGRADGDGPVLWGFTATSVASVSADPPMLCFSLDRSSSCSAPLARARTVAVSLLGDDQADAAAQFATRGADRFAGGGWTSLPTGEAVVVGARAWLRGTVTERVAAGRSTLALVLVTGTEHGSAAGRGPLVYHDRRYQALGPAAR